MTSADVAQDFVSLCKAGQFEEAGNRYWSDDVVSIEAFGDAPVAAGRAAVEAKSAWWYANMEVHSVKTMGPYVNGDQFVVNFTIDCTVKASGERSVSDEMAVYTVKNGKVVEERFFQSSMPGG
jgi:ketosteroid isomerase-like protein